MTTTSKVAAIAGGAAVIGVLVFLSSSKAKQSEADPPATGANTASGASAPSDPFSSSPLRPQLDSPGAGADSDTPPGSAARPSLPKKPEAAVSSFAGFTEPLPEGDATATWLGIQNDLRQCMFTALKADGANVDQPPPKGYHYKFEVTLAKRDTNASYERAILTSSQPAASAALARGLIGCVAKHFAKAVFPADLAGTRELMFVVTKQVPTPQPDPAFYASLELEKGPSRGPDDAPITLVVFSDFHCVFCGKVLGTLDELLTEYKGKIRVVSKTMPVKQGSFELAKATIAAGNQGKYWEMHNVLFANMDQQMPKRDQLVAYAKQLGLDVPRFERDFDTEATARAVQDQIDKAKALGVRGTPTVFVAGHRITGARPIQTYRDIIDAKLAAK